METEKSDWILSKIASAAFLRPADGEVGVLRAFNLFVLAQCPLFLSVLHYLLLHVEAFATAHTVHIFQSLVFIVCFLTKVQVFFFCCGNPVRIAADHLMHRGDSQKDNSNRNISCSLFAGYYTNNIIFVPECLTFAFPNQKKSYLHIKKCILNKT